MKLLKMSGASSSLVIPLVMWGPHPPAHCVSALYLLRDQKTLVSGSFDGQVFLWTVDTTTAKWSIVPRHVLIGHTAAVRYRHDNNLKYIL